MQTTVEGYLNDFRERQGDEAWKSEVTRLAMQAILKGGKHEAYWKDLTKDYEWLDWEAISETAKSGSAPNNPEMMMAELLRRQMPGIKSQAQYDAVVGAMEATQAVLSAILGGNAGGEKAARQALDMAFQAAAKATELTSKLSEVPEAATSEEAEPFKAEPAQFSENQTVTELLDELAAITSKSDLNAWYAETKSRRERVVSQALRNKLLDSIRAKNNAL